MASGNLAELIAKEFRAEYQRHWKHIQSRLRVMESDDDRKERARTEPEIARLWEMSTLEEKEAGGRELATSWAIGWAIIYALQQARLLS